MSLNNKWFNRFGMGKFAAVMWVINEVLLEETKTITKKVNR